MELVLKNAEMATLAKRVWLGVASDLELATAAVDDILAIKKELGVPRFTAFSAKVERVNKSDAKSRKRRFVASSEKADRMGDVIRVAGWSFKNFQENPVALWGHNSDLPIGTVEDWTKGTHNGARVLKETIDFAPADVTPAGDAALRLVDGGVVKATSVGFMPLENGVRVPDEAERKSEGMGPYGVIYEKQEQLELTVCSIPAHPDALLLKSLGLDQEKIDDALWDMAGKGLITDSVAESLCKAMGSDRLERRVLVSMAMPSKKEAEAVTETPVTPVLDPEAKCDAPMSETKASMVTCPGCGNTFNPEDTVGGTDPNEPDADDKSADDRVDTLTMLIEGFSKKVDQLEREVAELRAQIKSNSTPAAPKAGEVGSKDFYASLFAEVAKGI